MATVGDLAIVLHSHMPYVEGFGTYPFGEEWLFDAFARSHLPVLDVADRRVDCRLHAGLDPFGEEWLFDAFARSHLPVLDVAERVTMTVTPVLADQLEADGVGERTLTFLRRHRVDAADRDVAGLLALILLTDARRETRVATPYSQGATRSGLRIERAFQPREASATSATESSAGLAIAIVDLFELGIDHIRVAVRRAARIGLC